MTFIPYVVWEIFDFHYLILKKEKERTTVSWFPDFLFLGLYMSHIFTLSLTDCLFFILLPCSLQMIWTLVYFCRQPRDISLCATNMSPQTSVTWKILVSESRFSSFKFYVNAGEDKAEKENNPANSFHPKRMWTRKAVVLECNSYIFF